MPGGPQHAQQMPAPAQHAQHAQRAQRGSAGISKPTAASGSSKDLEEEDASGCLRQHYEDELMRYLTAKSKNPKGS